MIKEKSSFNKKYHRVIRLFIAFTILITSLAMPQCVTSSPISSLDISLLKLNMAANTQAIQLSWINITEDSNYYYRVERKKDSGGFTNYQNFFGQTSLYKMGDTVTTTDIIERGHVYIYRVSFFNMNSPLSSTIISDEVSVTSVDVKAPDSLKLTPVSFNRIDLEWSYENSASTDTVIERKVGKDGTWNTLATVPSGVTSFSDTGLFNNVQYFYRVKGQYNPHVYSATYPDDNNPTSAYTKLVAPAGLNGYASSQTQILLTWDESPGDCSYSIERRNENESNFTIVNTVAAHNTHWTDSGLSPNTWYVYRIRAVSGTSTSEYTPETAVASIFLEKPTNLTALAVSKSRVELKWSDNSNNETGFEVWRKEGQKGEWQKYAYVYRNETQFTDEDVSANNVYYYKIRGRISDSNANSDFSNETGAWMVAIAPPSDVQYSYAAGGSMKLSWKDNSNNESGFVVERKNGFDGVWTEIARLSANTAVYTGIAPPAGIQYFYRIKVYDNTSINAVSYSDAIPVEANVPKAPSGLQLEAVSSSQVKLAWTDNSDNEAGFRIERKWNTSAIFSEVAVVGASVRSYSDSNLSARTKYYYRVTAINNMGKSAYSNEDYVITRDITTFKDISGLAWETRFSIENLASRGVFKPTADNKFYPDYKLTRGEFILILVRAFKLKSVAAGSFADVSPKYKYYKEIMTAGKYGIIAGNSSSYFYPDRYIARQDMAVLLTRTLKVVGRPVAYHDKSMLDEFSDKDQISSYAENSIASLVGEGLLRGRNITGGKWVIAPEDNVTRAEASVLVCSVVD